MILPNEWQRHQGKICLRNEGDNSRPVCYTRFPLVHHIPFPYMIDYVGEGMNQSQHEHRITRPVVKHLEFLMWNTSQDSNHIGLCAQCPSKSQRQLK
jgi:hypothetical protein